MLHQLVGFTQRHCQSGLVAAEWVTGRGLQGCSRKMSRLQEVSEPWRRWDLPPGSRSRQIAQPGACLLLRAPALDKL